ncbi:hypothetical protein PCE1_001484 [Barthelona sp. PCE]
MTESFLPSYRRPKDTAFRQQRLAAWRPLVKRSCAIISFFSLFLVLFCVGLLLLLSSNTSSTKTVEYSSIAGCNIGDSCTTTFTISEIMKEPVFFYYKLENVFQNHRRYVQSRDDDQLMGVTGRTYSDVDFCLPMRTINDKDSEPVLNPCGLTANSVFNDTFSLLDPSSSPVTLSTDNISWKADDTKFKTSSEQSVDVTDPRFKNWMRVAALPNFMKLYGRIDRDLAPGTYTINLDNNWPVDAFDGKKSVVLTTTTWIGVSPITLGVFYLVTSIIVGAMGLSFVFM